MKQVHKKRRQGPSKINEFILTPAAVEEVILEEEEEEEQVFEEPSYHFDENKYERIIISSSEEEPVKHSASVSRNSVNENPCFYDRIYFRRNVHLIYSSVCYLLNHYSINLSDHERLMVKDLDVILKVFHLVFPIFQMN